MALRADDVDLGRDRDLVLCAQSGDDDAFGDLYRRYYARLYRFCLRRVGDPHEAEELTQEAFTRAYRALPRLEGERRFYPWLSVIASRLCVDVFRRRARSEPSAVVDLGALEGDEDKVDDALEVALVGRALDRLTPRHRHVLQLREHQGWSYQHIAEHYDVSLGTVEALLHRARKALRREFEVLADGEVGRAAGVPVLGWLARRMARARSRVAAWEPAWTPVLGHAVAAGAVLVGAAAGTSAPATVAVSMTPTAVVRQAPAPLVPAPAAPTAAARVAPTAAHAPPATGADTAAPAPVAADRAAPTDSGVIASGEARARAHDQPTGTEVAGTDSGVGVDPARAVLQAVETVDHNVEEFER